MELHFLPRVTDVDGEQSLYLESRSTTIRRVYLEQTWLFSLATAQCFLYNRFVY